MFRIRPHQPNPRLNRARHRSMRMLLLFCLAGLSINTIAQKQAYYWYFGNNAGLDFTGFDPVPLTDGRMISPEGAAAISDSTGIFLFYTDGRNLWDSGHSIIRSDLTGDSEATQSATIVPDSGNPGQYFVFTTRPFDPAAPSNYGGNYYTVKIQPDGTGSVIYDYASASGTGGLLANSTEKFVAVPFTYATDKTGYWFLMHEFNSNRFLKIKLDSIWHEPVFQAIGSVHANDPADDGTSRGAAGQMKVNDAGTLLAVAVEGGRFFEILTFRVSDGMISRPIQIPAGTDGKKDVPTLGAYGVEFSPTGRYGYEATSGNYLYGSTREGGHLYQWDLSLYPSNERELVKTSRIVYSNPEMKFGALQMAPNGKIYLVFEDRDYLGVINSPMRPDCKFQTNGARLTNNDSGLGGLSGFGLPSPVAVKNNPAPFYFENLCLGDETVFYITDQNGINGPRSLVITYLGVGVPVKNLSSTTFEFRYRFLVAGNYRVTLTLMRIGTTGPQRYTRNLTINPKPVVRLAAQDRVPLCWGSTLDLDAGPGAFYEWEDVSLKVRRRTVTTSDDPYLSLEEYRVKVTDYHGCIGWDTLQVERKTLPVIDSTYSIRAFCGDQNGVARIYPRGNINNFNFRWKDYPEVNSNILTGINGGDYAVRVIHKTTGCETADTIHVGELGGASVRLSSSGGFLICPGVQINLTVTGANEIEWLTPSNLSGSIVPVSLDTTTIFKVKATSRDEGRECFTYVTDTIHVFPKNFPDLGPDIVSCTGLTVEIDGGENYKQWEWTNGQTGRIAYITRDADTLVLSATDSNGCVFPDTIQVHFKPSPEFDLGNDTIIYTKDTITLSGIPGDRYRWNIGDTTPSIQVDTTGLYKLTVTRDGCSWTDSILIQYKDPPRLIVDSVVSRNISCNGAGDGFIRIYATGDPGNTIYYSIDNGRTFTDTTGIFERLPAGIYVIQVRVESERPQLWGYKIINEPGILKAKFCTLPPTCPSCLDGKIMVGKISGGTPPYKILIGGVEQDSVISGLGAGSYNLTVTDSMKCITTNTIVLSAGTRPEIIADKKNTICPGETVKLTIVNSDNVEWINPANDFRREITVRPSETTTYRVKSISTDADGFACETLLQHTVHVFPVTIPALENAVACDGETITLDGGEYVSWSWSNGMQGRIIWLQKPVDPLILTVTDINGCILKDTLAVTFANRPEIELGDDINSCVSDVILRGGIGYTYLWTSPVLSTGVQTQELRVSKSGKYYLEITENGCISIDSINVKLLDPGSFSISSVTATDNACFGEEKGAILINVTGSGSNFEYSIDGGITRQPGNRFENLSSGNYDQIWIRVDSLCSREYGETVRIGQPDSIHVEYELRSPGCETCSDGKLTLEISGGVEPYRITLSGVPVGLKTESLSVGIYTIIVTDANLCTKAVEFSLEMENALPNVITPNGDGINDLWKIPLLLYYSQAVVRVYNAAGLLVMESPPGYPIPWDGRYNSSPLPMGTYYYVINLGTGEKPLYGYLTILR